MTSRPVLATAVTACGLLLGLAGAGRAAPAAGVSVHIRVATSAPAAPSVQTFTLTCDPTGGDLPLAARVCRDVRLHPKAMLAPPKPRWTCSGAVGGPVLTVTTTARGATHIFGGRPGCDWPRGSTLELYFAATGRDTSVLDRIEPTLRCEEDPALLARPTPLASAVACAHGLWTPRSEKLIELAEQAPALAALQPARLFPRDIGVEACTLRPGGPSPGPRLAGRCGVTMKNVWSRPTVSFTEDWPTGAGPVARHVWHVLLRGNHVVSTTQSGPTPPQLCR